MNNLELGYAFSAQNSRGKFFLPNGERVAIIFHLPLEHWNPVVGEVGAHASIVNAKKTDASSAPDMVTYIWREYGHRVGLWRLMKLLDKFKIRASSPLNIQFAELYPSIMEEVKKRKWELAAHAYSQNDRMTQFTGDEGAERKFIRKNLEDFERIVGVKSYGWVSPGVTPTMHTAKIVAEQNVKFYCDYQNDDQPYLIKFGTKSTVCVPYSNELGDYTLYLKYHYTPDQVLETIKEHFDCVYKEGKSQAKIMHISMHAHVSGQASRVWVLHEAIEYFLRHKKIWFATRGEIADWYLEVMRRKKGGKEEN